jgi:two-component system response regulator FlrC
MNQPHLDRLSLLYVEDDPEVWTLLERPLKRRVGEVRYAHNGREGLEMMEEQPPQIVVTDLEMPEMGGLEMIRRVRERWGRELPIIVATAYSDPEHHTELADAYLFKPFGIGKLVEAIERLAPAV